MEGPPQRKDHYTQPRLLLPLRNLLGEEVEGEIHQRLVPLQVVVVVVYLKLRMY